VPLILEMAVWGDPDTKAPPGEIAKIRNNRREYIEIIRNKFKYLD